MNNTRPVSRTITVLFLFWPTIVMAGTSVGTPVGVKATVTAYTQDGMVELGEVENDPIPLPDGTWMVEVEHCDEQDRCTVEEVEVEGEKILSLDNLLEH